MQDLHNIESHRKLSIMLTRYLLSSYKHAEVHCHPMGHSGLHWRFGDMGRSRPISACVSHGQVHSGGPIKVPFVHPSGRFHMDILSKLSTTACEANVPSPQTNSRPARKHSNNARRAF